MFILIIVVLIVNIEGATEGAREALEIAGGGVVTTILPFCVLSGGVLYTKSGQVTEKIFRPLMRLFGINEKGSLPFFMSFLAGFPTGGKIVFDMYSAGEITKEEAEELLGFVNNGGIIFALAVVGEKMFASPLKGGVIFISTVISSLITGGIFSKSHSGGRRLKKETLPLHEAFGKAMASGGNVAMGIVSSMVVFYAIAKGLYLNHLGAVQGILEVTMGIKEAAKINSVPLGAAFFSFGGLSVFSQLAALNPNGEIKMKKYLLAKVLQSVLSFFIASLLMGVAY